MKSKVYKIMAPAMKHRDGWKCPKTELHVVYSESRMGVPWKTIRPMIACAFRHVQREAFNDLKLDFIIRNKGSFTTLYLRKSKRCWHGRNSGMRSFVFVGKLHEDARETTYPKFVDMPVFWHKDWREHLVGLTAHELWHRWQPGSGKQAEIMCELVESDAIDAYRKQEGYTFTPPATISATAPTPELVTV